MKHYQWMTALLIMAGPLGESYGAEADCYDKGDYYYIPAEDLLAAKKKALLCFFAEITVKSSSREDNQKIEFNQETKLDATSSIFDWQGLRKADSPNLYRWSIKDVNDNLKRLASVNTSRLIPVEKEVQEVWRSNSIKKEIIEINSRPQNASVTFDGVENACQTPCKLEVLHGSHAISLWKQDYSRVSGTFSVDTSHDSFSFDLKENISRVNFKDCPSGTDIRIDGNRYGNTSDSAMKLAPGTYILEFEHPEYFKSNQKISVNVGDNITVNCGLKPKIGGVDVSARNSMGEPVKATVEIDGVSVGKTPGNFDVRAGSRRVRVSTNDEVWEETITVTKSQTLSVVAKLKPKESDAEKAIRRSYRSYAVMVEIGSMNEIKARGKSSNIEYTFSDCSDSQTPEKGDTGRVFISKNFTDNIGINIGYLSGKYTACHRAFVANYYEPQITGYNVAFSGPTVGVNYALINQWNIEQNQGGRNFTRWLDFRLSYIPGLDLTVADKNNQAESNYKLSGAALLECSLATVTVDYFKLSLINVSFVKTPELPESSLLDLGSFSMLSIIGFGLSF